MTSINTRSDCVNPFAFPTYFSIHRTRSLPQNVLSRHNGRLLSTNRKDTSEGALQIYFSHLPNLTLRKSQKVFDRTEAQHQDQKTWCSMTANKDRRIGGRGVGLGKMCNNSNKHIMHHFRQGVGAGCGFGVGWGFGGMLKGKF